MAIGPAEAINGAKRALMEEFGAQLQMLLQERHLYQKVDVDKSKIVDRFRQLLEVSHQSFFDSVMDQFMAGRFHPDLGFSHGIDSLGGEHLMATPLLRNIKLFCKKCKSKEVFSPIWFLDLANELLKSSYRESAPQITFCDGFQLLFLSYQCQLCKELPEGMIVRRSGFSLILEGRSPMEEISVPTELPKQERRHYSDAVVAFNSGKELAALFYLRTFIEQFARRMTKANGRVNGESLMDAYAQTLPSPQRDQMPSLREWYEKLSVDIHAANVTEGRFESATSAIVKHFKFRDIFDLN